MLGVQFLSDDWLRALDGAARSRVVPEDDPLGAVELVIEQEVTDGPTWRLVIDRGALHVARSGDRPADVRLVSDRETAAAIASGRRAALDAFIGGDLVLGGNVQTLLEHRVALEAVGDLFAQVSANTDFSR